MVCQAGLYETPSEYVRDLIRRDMERRGGQFAQDAILAGQAVSPGPGCGMSLATPTVQRSIALIVGHYASTLVT